MEAKLVCKHGHVAMSSHPGIAEAALVSVPHCGVVQTRDAPTSPPQSDVVNSDRLQSNHAPTEDIVVSAVLLRRVRRRVLCIGTTLGEDGRSSVAPSIETV
jgi:hypothetical protein